MPVYKNFSTTEVYEGQGVRLEPGETKQTTTYLVSLPVHVSKLSDVGCYDPIVSCTLLEEGAKDQTIEVPATLTGNYKITFDPLMSVGTTIKLNSADSVAKVIPFLNIWSVTCLSRIVDKVIVNVPVAGGDSTNNAIITIEKI